MKTMPSIAFLAAAGLCCTSAQSQDVSPGASVHISPAQSIAAAYKPNVRQRFLTLNYTSMICTTPDFTIMANQITSGMPVYGQPMDNQWLEKQKSLKNCWQQPPNEAFYVTDAVAVGIGQAGIVWVAGVVVPKSGKIVGFIPIEDIQTVPEF